MQALTGWLMAFLCAVALVVCLLAGAAYTQQADFQNQTDSFGQSHTTLENNTAQAITNASQGATDISAGMLILAAAFILLLFVAAAFFLTHQPKW
jgi:uncharacterized membrane protein YjgN (DUF898 family)